MAQEPISNDVLKDFVDVFLRTQDSGESDQSPVWNQLEELARQTVRKVGRLKRPQEVDPRDWVLAHKMLDFAAHSIVGPRATYVLGFLPIVLDSMGRSIDSMKSTWNMSKFSEALQYRYEYKMAVKPVWIEQDTLSNAEPSEIQQLLQDLVAGKPVDSMWHRPDSVQCEDMCVRIFYVPVVYSVKGKMETDWRIDDVYDQVDDTDAGESHLRKMFYETFEMAFEGTLGVQLAEIGIASDVTSEALTIRDMWEIETRLGMMKEAVSQNGTADHSVKIEIQLTWATGVETQLKTQSAPAIRFAVTAQREDDSEAHRMVVGVHVGLQYDEEWGVLVQDLLGICLRAGWPNVQIKQHTSVDALNYWSEMNTPHYLM